MSEITRLEKTIADQAENTKHQMQGLTDAIKELTVASVSQLEASVRSEERFSGMIEKSEERHSTVIHDLDKLGQHYEALSDRLHIVESATATNKSSLERIQGLGIVIRNGLIKWSIPALATSYLLNVYVSKLLN